MKLLKKLIICVLLCVSVLSLHGCAADKTKYNKLEDLNNATLGVVTGSLYDGYSREMFPDANIVYYKNFSELLQALKKGKVNACMLDKPNFNAVKRTEPTLSFFDVPAYSVEIGFAFQKNQEGSVLQTKMNNLLDELYSDGTMDTLIDKWYGSTEPTDAVSVPDLSTNLNRIRVAMDVSRKPNIYYLNGEYAGLEAELFYMFCDKYGYAPVFENVSFASGIVGLNSKKYDMVVGGIYMTDERKLSVNFCKPYMNADVVMAIMNDSISSGLLTNIKSNFSKTFIEEDRWKSIISGIDTTLLITVISSIFGTLLGFSFYMFCKVIGKFAKTFIKILSTITRGTPAVVVLMILYYVVFGNSVIDGITVSIVGFSLIFATVVCDKLTISIDSVDKGQNEAALAMGFTDIKSFFVIILPQALKTFMPLFRTEIASLVKSTSVVGYIAVQDLTQVSDIIRSNTYEALFPLIASAAIYILLAFILTRFINFIIEKIEPKNRNKSIILKGINIK